MIRLCFSLFVSYALMIGVTKADFVLNVDNSSNTSNSGGFGLAEAVLQPSFQSNQIDVDGYALLSVNGASGTFAEAVYDIEFSVTNATPFILGANLSSFATSGTATVSLELTGLGVNITTNSPDPNLVSAGILQAGNSYHLLVRARVDQGVNSADAGADFVLTLSSVTAVPEPSSFCTLLCSGVLSTCMLRIRSKSKSC